MRTFTTVVLPLVLSLTFASPLSAGSFVMQDTHINKSDVAWNGKQNVTVGAVAEYVGELDDANQSWSINTELEAGPQGTFGTAMGAGNSGDGITAGMSIECKASQHGAALDVDHCSGTGNNVFLHGSGIAAIYRQYNPEITVPRDAYGETDCEGAGGGFGGAEGTDPESPPGDGTGTEPLVIDMDRRGFRFSSLEGGVLFDLNADGAVEPVSWTTTESGDAFLALDRNANGWIDDGSELFGDVTDQPVTANPHGFLALQVFDDPAAGGDGDGWISTSDAVFADLLLWTDRNHNGLSESEELMALTDGSVEQISLRPVESRRMDRHGNFLRFKGQVRLHGRVTQSVDVYFLTE